MMQNETIATVHVVKASSVGIATSSGAISLGRIQISEDMVVLGIIGLVVSLLAYAYEYHHNELKETRGAMVTSIGLYSIFGTFALPAGFVATMTYITSDVMTCMLGGMFASWSVVAVLKSFKNRAVKEIGERKL